VHESIQLAAPPESLGGRHAVDRLSAVVLEIIWVHERNPHVDRLWQRLLPLSTENSVRGNRGVCMPP
jgi:hypothetical protein